MTNHLRHGFLLGVSFGLLLSTAACSSPKQEAGAAEENAVREADIQWSKTAGTRDLEATISYYADDATVLPPNAPVATGKQAIRAVWAPMLAPDSSISWEVTKVEVARSGELAYVLGTYQLASKTEPDKGKLLEVWKKQADGKWKVVADIFNSDLPLPGPPAKTK